MKNGHNVKLCKLLHKNSTHPVPNQQKSNFVQKNHTASPKAYTIEVNSENVQPIQIPIMDVISKINHPLIFPHMESNHAPPNFNLNFVS